MFPTCRPETAFGFMSTCPKTSRSTTCWWSAFLRGSTNPPPEEWFTRAETWNKQVIAEGITVTVPEDAQQAILFLAPETGGDFSSLRSAVRSKPGTFVRATQDLNQASLDRTRSDRYLDNIKASASLDPQALHDRSVLLARTLGIKLDQQCFDRPAEQQSACLTQNSDQLVLDDGHTQSMVAALTSGPSHGFDGSDQCDVHGRRRILQRVRWSRSGCGENPEQPAHSQLPVHSGAGCAARPATESASE